MKPATDPAPAPTVPTGAQYQNRHGLWGGDAFGHEWPLGWTIWLSDRGWEVYEDDGRGNGDFVAAFDSESEAEACCRRLADATTYADVARESQS